MRRANCRIKIRCLCATKCNSRPLIVKRQTRFGNDTWYFHEANFTSCNITTRKAKGMTTLCNQHSCWWSKDVVHITDIISGYTGTRRVEPNMYSRQLIGKPLSNSMMSHTANESIHRCDYHSLTMQIYMRILEDSFCSKHVKCHSCLIKCSSYLLFHWLTSNCIKHSGFLCAFPLHALQITYRSV